MEREDVKNLIKELLEKIVEEESIVVEDSDNVDFSKHWFRVGLSDPRPFLRREGEALASLNHLAKKIVDSKLASLGGEGESIDLLIDVNDFQKKRIENLHTLAHMMAERARYFKSSIEVDPMSAFERKIIHEFLADATDLETESEGTGRNRRVVIKYTGKI